MTLVTVAASPSAQNKAYTTQTLRSHQPNSRKHMTSLNILIILVDVSFLSYFSLSFSSAKWFSGKFLLLYRVMCPAILNSSPKLLKHTRDSWETDRQKVSTWWVGSRHSFLLPLSLLLLLLGNTPKDVIVCVKSLQDILFQLWQHNKGPGGKRTDRQPSVSIVSLCNKTLSSGFVWFGVGWLLL